MAFEADPANAIVVRGELRSLHPLVKLPRDASDETRKDHADYWRRGRPQQLDIDVSKAQWRRALRIMDALLKAFEARGWTIALGTGDDRKSYVTILGQRLTFGIREVLKKVANPPPKPERLVNGTVYTPFHRKYRDERSGLLAFVMRYSWGHGVQKCWPETKTRPLEERLSDFIVSLVTVAHEFVESAKRRAEMERERQEAEEQRRAEERRREAEVARVRALHRQSVRWETSKRVHSYLKAVRAVAESQPGGLQADSDFSNWLAWAEGYTRSIDPLQQPLERLMTVPRSSDDTEEDEEEFE